MADETKAPEAAETLADKGAEVATGAGMPQLEFSTFSNQIFWLVVALLAIFYILSRVALPRIAAVLAERNGTITNDLAAAEELKQRAVEAEAAYEKALAEARAESQKIAAETRAEIQADLDAATAKADAEISARAAESEAKISEIRASAVDSISTVANDAAGELAKVLGADADGKAIAAAVEARMKGMN